MFPFQQVPLKIVGPSRYCPDCRRLLLEVKEDEGTFSLGPNTNMVIEGHASFNPFTEELPDELEGFPTVLCMRRLCRLRRWRRGERDDLPQPPQVQFEMALAHLRRRARVLMVLSLVVLATAILNIVLVAVRELW